MVCFIEIKETKNGNLGSRFSFLDVSRMTCFGLFVKDYLRRRYLPTMHLILFDYMKLFKNLSCLSGTPI